jgi:hypothetical protein
MVPPRWGVAVVAVTSLAVHCFVGHVMCILSMARLVSWMSAAIDLAMMLAAVVVCSTSWRGRGVTWTRTVMWIARCPWRRMRAMASSSRYVSKLVFHPCLFPLPAIDLLDALVQLCAFFGAVFFETPYWVDTAETSCEKGNRDKDALSVALFLVEFAIPGHYWSMNLAI